ATGIAGAHHLANRVAAGEPGAVDSYREFLKSAGSMYPLDGLRMAGVDMSSPEPVQAAFATLADMVTRLESLVARGVSRDQLVKERPRPPTPRQGWREEERIAQ